MGKHHTDTRKKKPRYAKRSAIALALLVTFAQNADGFGPTRVMPYDETHTHLNSATTAAIVYTGEAQRLPAALQLYMDGKVDYVFVSGYNNNFSADELLRRWNITPTRDTSNIFFGRQAHNTYTNAQETGEWLATMATQRGVAITDVLLVTSDYHMPRASTNTEYVLPSSINIHQYNVDAAPSLQVRLAETLKATLTDATYSVGGVPLMGNLPQL